MTMHVTGQILYIIQDLPNIQDLPCHVHGHSIYYNESIMIVILLQA